MCLPSKGFWYVERSLTSVCKLENSEMLAGYGSRSGLLMGVDVD